MERAKPNALLNPQQTPPVPGWLLAAALALPSLLARRLGHWNRCTPYRNQYAAQ
jgi:hypothetical protein